MRLIILYSKKNMILRLINIDAQNTEGSSERDLATCAFTKGSDLRWTCWKNQSVNSLNPYKYNRVNFHYTHEDGRNITQSYYCIESVILMEDMKFNDFDSNIIKLNR